MTRRDFLAQSALGVAVVAGVGSEQTAPAKPRPNIVFILADDIGYGDIGCYGAPITKTPNADRIAREGVRFTDAHSPAACCTPTRYSLLTGQYAWRNPDGDHVLSGVAPLSISVGMPTLPSILRDAGYATGLVGKWHLGLGSREHPVDFNGDVMPGPVEVGFDNAFYFPATGDRVPCVFVDGHRVVGLDPADPIQVSYTEKVGDEPTGLDHPELLKMKADRSHSQTIVNGISRIGYMSGGKAARWVDEDIADTLTRKAVEFIEHHREKPFFLYFATNDIHEPMAPHPRFKGTSDCGTRGDAIHEFDWSVGEVLAALDRFGLAENTLLIVSSDNGGALKDTYDDGTNELHGKQPPNGPLRGEKFTLFEGGHREPFIARWPGCIKPGTTSDELICLVDMLSTLAAAAGASVPKEAGPDSFNVLPALLGQTAGHPSRDSLVMHVSGPDQLALRKGPWKLLTKKGLEPVGLFRLDKDLAETKNLLSENPEKARELRGLLEQIVKKGRSRQ